MQLLSHLRTLYLEDLTKMVKYDPKENERPRVRHPEKWKKLKSCIKGQDNMINISPENNVWVWSDLHFFHNNIISFADRPFMNVKEMNQQLLDNFNEYVDEDDVSIWVGDVGFKKTAFINELLDQCNGYKILVVGNHDFDHKQVAPLNFDEIYLLYKLEFPNAPMVFTHYPMYNIPDGYFNIHGHLHRGSDQTSKPQFINVCCEFHEFKPINMQQILKWIKLRKTKILMNK